MGILGLSKLIRDFAPDAVKRIDLNEYRGLKIAVDARTCLYQFLVDLRQDADAKWDFSTGITHIVGILYCAKRFFNIGILPVFVLYGNHSQVMNEKSRKRREKSRDLFYVAAEAGDLKEVDRQKKKLYRMSNDVVTDVTTLLGLLGIPFVMAPGEAIAQCAALEKAGIVSAVASDDTAGVVFGTRSILRHMTLTDKEDREVTRYELDKILQALELTFEQFVGLCILLGCDYCDPLKGIDHEEAIGLIKKHPSLDFLDKVDKEYFNFEENWPYQDARLIFKNPKIQEPSSVEVNWTPCDEEGLVNFLCTEKGIDEVWVRLYTKMIQEAQEAWNQNVGSVQFQDSRVNETESVLAVLPSTSTNTTSSSPVNNLESRHKQKVEKLKILIQMKDELISVYRKREEGETRRETALDKRETAVEQREHNVLAREDLFRLLIRSRSKVMDPGVSSTS